MSEIEILGLFGSIANDTYDGKYSDSELLEICESTPEDEYFQYKQNGCYRVERLTARNVARKIYQVLEGNGTLSSLSCSGSIKFAIAAAYNKEFCRIRNGGYDVYTPYMMAKFVESDKENSWKGILESRYGR